METVKTRNSVLDKELIGRKLRRIALEIAERNSDEEELVIAGIAGNGAVVAQCLIRELKAITAVRTVSITIQLNKKDPLDVLLEPALDPAQKAIILVDDVANTGRTLLYALKPFLQTYPRKIQTAVLVERSHKLFPVQTDYVGLSITTTLQEHIYVEAKGDELIGAYLE